MEHPYSYVVRYAKCLKGDKAKLQKMVQMAWTFVNDSLCTTLSLQWEPEVIAVALMYLAGKLSQFEVVDWAGRTPKHLRWWDMFVQDVTMDLLEDICHQVLDLYSQPAAADVPDSPPLPPRPVPAAGVATAPNIEMPAMIPVKVSGAGASKNGQDPPDEPMPPVTSVKPVTEMATYQYQNYPAPPLGAYPPTFAASIPAPHMAAPPPPGPPHIAAPPPPGAPPPAVYPPYVTAPPPPHYPAVVPASYYQPPPGTVQPPPHRPYYPPPT